MEKGDEVARNARSSGSRSRRGSRLAFAGAVTAAMLGVFVSLGAASYAASSTTHAVQVIKKVATAKKVVVHHSSADDQYPTQEKAKKHTQKPLLPPKQTPPSGSNVSVSTPTQGTLPYTGISLLATAIVSGLLVLLGLALRRREKRASS